MLPSVTGCARIVPLESFVDITGATHVMPIRFAIASQDVDKSGSNTAHTASSLALCVPAKNRQKFRENLWGILEARESCTLPEYAGT